MKSLLKKNHIPTILLIDIGGTNFRAAFYNHEAKPLQSVHRFSTPNFIDNPKLPIKKLQSLLIQEIVATVKKYQTKKHIKIVGLSFPAPITSNGYVTQACTIWGNRGKNYHLLKILESEMPDIYWILDNDITAATERYANMKKYQNIDYFAVVTISSGIGNKIYDVKNRKVILDKKSIGGEIGHIKLDFSENAPICDCGGRGHLGALSSGRAVERMAISTAHKYPDKFRKSYLFKLTENPDNIDNRAIVKAIKKRDGFSLQILDRSTFPLACTFAHISGNLGVDKFIIIGGFALNCGNPYLESLRMNLLKTDFYGRKKKEIPHIVELGINDDNDALIGIGLLAKRKYLENEQ